MDRFNVKVLFIATLTFNLFHANLCASSSTCKVYLDHVKDKGNFPLMATLDGEMIHAKSDNSAGARVVENG